MWCFFDGGDLYGSLWGIFTRGKRTSCMQAQENIKWPQAIVPLNRLVPYQWGFFKSQAEKFIVCQTNGWAFCGGNHICWWFVILANDVAKLKWLKSKLEKGTWHERLIGWLWNASWGIWREYWTSNYVLDARILPSHDFVTWIGRGPTYN